jgi:DNA topoisomerase-1
MNLIIVESPTKARTLSQFLGKDYQIVSTMGHIRDLPAKKLAIDIKNNFQPEYVLLSNKREAIAAIKNASKKAGKIFLATDPDREGEAIAYHVGEILPISTNTTNKYQLQRISFHEITKKAVEKAISNPRQIDMALVNAQQARRILDRLVGYKLSPLLWFKIRKGLSAGRVQSPTVRLIVEREREIEKFVPEEYWEIWAELKKHLGGKLPDAPVFSAKLSKKNGETIKITDESGAEELVKELKEAGYEVAEIVQREVRRRPSPPFITSTLQQQGALRLGWTPKRTMQIAQRLYEQGLITYHRTDSTNIAEEAISAARKLISKKYGQEFLPEQARRYKTKTKMAQEAHEAVRPTDVKVSSLESQVSNTEEGRLYELIWKRFLASQMVEAIFDETKVQVLATSKVNHYLLEAIGQIMKFKGWLILYDSAEKKEGEEELPELKKGDELDLVKIRPEQKFTQPPPRYNEATLIKALEEYGIGRPSTYAPIISTIQDRQYVEKIEKRFRPTPLGLAVNDFLVEYFDDIVDYQFTAQMEDNLDEIAEGKKEWVAVLKQFYQPFGEKVKAVSKVAEKVPVQTEATDENCPDCGAPLVIRIGRFGKFLSCSKFPECKFTKPYLREAGFNCQKCGAPMVIKKSKKGKTFFGCSRWPDCDGAAWRKPKTSR